jgi:DnaJ family protein C protein 7
MEKAKQEAN